MRRGLLAVAFVMAALGFPSAGFPQDPPLMPPPAQPPARPPAPKPLPAGLTLKLVPKARKLSTYLFDGSVTTVTRDVSYDGPPAYRENFDFWIGRMKGAEKRELIQFSINTKDALQDGTVPFRRDVARFQIDLVQGGQTREPVGPLVRDVKGLSWEGFLDPLGNVKEMHRVAGEETPEMAHLSFPILEKAFPRLDGPLEIKAGEGFTDVNTSPLPSRLPINGLEETQMQITRRYVLKDLGGDRAVFEVRTSYAVDPATPPRTPRTACTIGGGGTGEAVFDVKRGVFLSTRLPTKMTIDIEAPLRPLPDVAGAENPGVGKTRIDLDVTLFVTQTVRRVWGEDAD